MALITDTLTAAANAVNLPLGTHYNLNWRSGGGGIDCSGFVSAIARYFGATNISATDWTGSLFPKTDAVSGPPQIGDLVFFGDPNSVDSHVAIWTGGDQIMQSSTDGGVNFGSLSGVSSFYHGNVQYREIPALTQALSNATTSSTPGTNGGNSGGYNPYGPGGVLGGSTGATPLSSNSTFTQIGSIAGQPVNIPSGMVLGLIAVAILLLGVILFATNFVNVQTPGVSVKTPQVKVPLGA